MPGTPQKKLLLAAMPSSGSDWFASCILKSSDRLVSHPTAKEPLNPICNLQHFDALARVFGCEAEPAIANIAANPSKQLVDEAIAIAIPPEVNFIKEVWVGYQLPQLQRHFEIITLTRSLSNTFPPSRIRVYAWYLALARSIELNSGRMLPTAMHERVARAFLLYYSRLRYGWPTTLSWEFLMQAERPQLIDCFYELKLGQYLNCELLAENIIATRTART
jgi:hypothetical protein